MLMNNFSSMRHEVWYKPELQNVRHLCTKCPHFFNFLPPPLNPPLSSASRNLLFLKLWYKLHDIVTFDKAPNPNPPPKKRKEKKKKKYEEEEKIQNLNSLYIFLQLCLFIVCFNCKLQVQQCLKHLYMLSLSFILIHHNTFWKGGGLGNVFLLFFQI